MSGTAAQSACKLQRSRVREHAERSFSVLPRSAIIWLQRSRVREHAESPIRVVCWNTLSALQRSRVREHAERARLLGRLRGCRLASTEPRA